jgi:TolA-binding protein
VRSLAPAAGLTTLLWTVALTCAHGVPAHAADPGADSARVLDRSGEAIDEPALRLGRAVMEQRAGNLRGVIENLESIDLSAASEWPEADRAAFLLAQAYRRLGSTDRLLALARTVAAWPRPTAYTRWIAFQRALLEIHGPDLAAGRDAALETTGAESALTLWYEALARAATGEDDEPVLARLSGADTASALGRDLAGAASLTRATRMLSRGEDPGPLLEAVPAGSRYAARARHMLGLLALERGDSTLGRRTLESLIADEPGYAGRREALLALAGLALDQGRWDDAQATYGRIERDWTQHADTLRRLMAYAAFDELWAAWEKDVDLPEALMIDAAPLERSADRLAEASLDLHARPEPVAPPVVTPDRISGVSFVPPPPAQAWRAAAASGRALADAEHELERAAWAIEAERRTLGDRARYLGVGLGRVREEQQLLAARSAFLDSLRGTLEALDARLRAVRDTATRRIVARAAAVLEAVERHARWTAAMRHLHLEGPNRERPILPPPGYPGADRLLDDEDTLARSVAAAAESLAAQAPGLIARSYAQAWRPGLIDRATAQGLEAGRALAWARALASSIDSSVAAQRDSDSLRALLARSAGLERSRDSLRAADSAMRTALARDAVAQALLALDREREAIDYGLGISAYGLSVLVDRRPPADTARVEAGPIRVAGAETAGSDTLRMAFDPNPEASELDDPETAAWRARALRELDAFLVRHPDSPARGEVRFRLADLLMVDARQAFRHQMAGYTAEIESGAAPSGEPPVLESGPALALYRSILAEDRDFEHRDAVLFNAGMILADARDPEAHALLGELVSQHPGSRHVQEASLRMGDLHFEEQRYAECIDLYRRAAAGSDTSLRAIALYKMGWAQYDEERWSEAADAFRAVLDLYESADHLALNVNIAPEAETFLIHSLARAGGPRAFTEYFDRIGPRPYEARLMLAMGQHLRHYSLYAEAAANESLFIARHPQHPDALLSAQRLTDTYLRWNRPALARQARLDQAARFAPGGAWAQAQASDSVRAAGEAYAKGSWMAVAVHHHLEARRKGSREDWVTALQLYRTLLEHWPKDAEAPTYQLHAGEACLELGDHAAALTHYEAAAATGADSIAMQAMLQRVAVTDAWYERTRAASARGAGATGSDSLARAMLARGDELLARYPRHPKAGDVMWRQGNLAFAHGWFDRAAADFGRLTESAAGDPRVPAAAGLRAEAFYRAGDFEAAGRAFEATLEAATRSGADSLARRAAQAIPVCYFRHAESVARTDSTDHARIATLFEKVAAGWPDYELAHVAQYRAALAYVQAGHPRDGVRAFESLIRGFPSSEYVQDAHLQVARTWEAAGERARAAEAYAAFATRYPKDESAPAAWLKAADLYEAAGDGTRAETLRLAYLEAHPDDVESAMEILEPLARRELAAVTAERPVSTLLPPPAAPKAKPATGKGKSAKAKARSAAPPAATSAAPRSRLAAYLERAAARPDLASHDLLAQVRFLEGEESRTAYEAARLSQPLERSIPAKQKLLDLTLERYRRSVELGVSQWAHASAYRIGEALIGFGEALESSERPPDLAGEDLQAYEDVLLEQSQPFRDRGEAVWADLLRQKGRDADDDPWIARAQSSLWKRLGARFLFRPEAEYPLIRAAEPEAPRAEARSGRGGAAPESTRSPRSGTAMIPRSDGERR